jgi:hypothetical protein
VLVVINFFVVVGEMGRPVDEVDGVVSVDRLPCVICLR